ncbi:related to histone H1-binding protein [Cephalotrichum gorgonifer]|uniref:Related to histone H1-binding protein n=1 Tax=Cephalotrichum gorgonifer TaxID=2041049 RepID=A0AAE8T009_9PEZI|nr:related to histone H1-binding protein [Cephalotrichum gorgonifer]
MADQTTAPPPDAAAETRRKSEEMKSERVTLADVCAKGAAHYVHKRYEEAAGAYAHAAELQAELNGEMDPENADVLFLYGRSLFKVGQGNSDVLGGKAGGAEKKKKAPAGGAPASKKEAPAGGKKKEGGDKEGVKKEEAGEAKKEGEVEEAKKPLFQFEGDENYDDSDEDEEEGGDEDEEEEEDDLAVAFEVLDLARVLFVKRLEQLEATKEEEKEHVEPTIRHVKERLADTHDLLSEISLENERYPAAITDGRASLAYKKDLYPPESEIIAEAHYKLSLALEFASITTTEGEGVGKRESVDQAQRDEACKELQAAIDSTKLKLQSKEVELATSAAPDENDATREQINEVKEIIADMEQRLTDLRGPPIDINETLYGAKGLLGAAAAGGASGSKIQEAKKNATDLSSLVRKKAKDETPAATTPSNANGNGNGKRKAEGEGDETSKKAKVEDEA